MGEGLAQGFDVAARVGFEPATLRMQGTELTSESSRPARDMCMNRSDYPNIEHLDELFFLCLGS